MNANPRYNLYGVEDSVLATKLTKLTTPNAKKSTESTTPKR